MDQRSICKAGQCKTLGGKYKQNTCVHAKSCPTLCDWTAGHQAPLFMGLSRQEYWSGLPRPSLGNLPNPGTEPSSLTYPALTGRFFTTSTTWEANTLLKPVSIKKESKEIKNILKLPWYF